MLAISFGGETPVNSYDEKWFAAGKSDLLVIARLLFRQSAAPSFGTFCKEFDSALTNNQLGTAHVDQMAVLKTICDINKPAILIVDELSKLVRLGGMKRVEKMRHKLCSWMDAAWSNFFVMFTTLHSGIMKKEYTNSQQAIIPILLPALNQKDSQQIFSESLARKRWWHIGKGKKQIDPELVAHYLAAVSGGHPRSIEVLLTAANSARSGAPLSHVLESAAKQLESRYPALHDYPPVKGRDTLPPGPGSPNLLDTAFRSAAENYPGMDQSTCVGKASDNEPVPLTSQDKFSAASANTVLRMKAVSKSYNAARTKMEKAGWDRSQFVHIFFTWGQKMCQECLGMFHE